jgi:hypothetical protein
MLAFDDLLRDCGRDWWLSLESSYMLVSAATPCFGSNGCAKCRREGGLTFSPNGLMAMVSKSFCAFVIYVQSYPSRFPCIMPPSLSCVVFVCRIRVSYSCVVSRPHFVCASSARCVRGSKSKTKETIIQRFFLNTLRPVLLPISRMICSFRSNVVVDQLIAFAC